MSISERLRYIVGFKGVSVRAFAIKIGTSSQVFGKYLEGRTPAAEVLTSIIETYDDISAEWLLTGRGEMLKAETLSSDDSIEKSQQRTIEDLTSIIKVLTSK